MNNAKPHTLEETIARFDEPKQYNGPAMKTPRSDDFAQMAVDLWNLPIIDSHDYDQVQQRVAEVFEICAKHHTKPLLAAVSFGLNLSFGQFRDIVIGSPNTRNYSEDVRQLYRRIYLMMNTYHEQSMDDAKNPAAMIFMSKNYYGYKDVQEHVVSQDPTSHAQISAIDARYSELPPAHELPALSASHEESQEERREAEG